jgi:hypothetical protein
MSSADTMANFKTAQNVGYGFLGISRAVACHLNDLLWQLRESWIFLFAEKCKQNISLHHRFSFLEERNGRQKRAMIFVVIIVVRVV